MIFNSCGKPLNSYSFRYGANKLEKVKSCKYLGLILSPYGNFHLARQMTGIEKCSLNALNKLRKEMGGHFRGNIKLTTKLFVTLIFGERRSAEREAVGSNPGRTNTQGL